MDVIWDSFWIFHIFLLRFCHTRQWRVCLHLYVNIDTTSLKSWYNHSFGHYKGAHSNWSPYELSSSIVNGGISTRIIDTNSQLDRFSACCVNKSVKCYGKSINEGPLLGYVCWCTVVHCTRGDHGMMNTVCHYSMLMAILPMPCWGCRVKSHGTPNLATEHFSNIFLATIAVPLQTLYHTSI